MQPETNRRRATVRWTSSSDDGDATEAVAEIEAWLIANPVGEADWEGVLAQVRDAVLRASLQPVLMGDADARAILLVLAAAEDLQGLDAAIARLDDRVTRLVQARECQALALAWPVERLLSDHRASPPRTMVRI